MPVAYDPGWNTSAAALLGVVDEQRKRFSPAPSEALRIPDEMTDAHGGELLAIVPVGQARNRSAGFVLPYFTADFLFFSLR